MRDDVRPFLNCQSGARGAAFTVIPVFYEPTVSWQKGAARGAQALLEASVQLEAFDGRGAPLESGIHTREALRLEQAPPEVALAAIRAAVEDALRRNSVPVVLGGEHTVALGAVRAFARRGAGIGVVQFDAHADLRTAYEGDPFSHACVMRRILELDLPLLQIGVRSLCADEDALRRREPRIAALDAETIVRHGVPPTVIPDRFPPDVYLTFDVDALDPSLLPATGTPEPGGLGWYETVDLLRILSRERNVLGFDVVELSPRPDLHASDFVAAKLVYTLMGFILESRNRR